MWRVGRGVMSKNRFDLTVSSSPYKKDILKKKVCAGELNSKWWLSMTLPAGDLKVRCGKRGLATQMESTGLILIP